MTKRRMLILAGLLLASVPVWVFALRRSMSVDDVIRRAEEGDQSAVDELRRIAANVGLDDALRGRARAAVERLSQKEPPGR